MTQRFTQVMWRASALLFMTAGMWATTTVQALAEGKTNSPTKGQFYVSPGVIAYEGPNSSQIGHDGVDAGAALILGYSFSERWSVELLGGRVESDFDNRWGEGEDDVDLRWVDLMYRLDARDAWQPFVLFGAGRTEYGFDGVRADAKDNQFNAGMGVFRQLNKHFALRADLRATTSNKAGKIMPFAFVGLTGFIGEGSGPAVPSDSDGDGVPNKDDQCPTTPPGRVVDATGCQLDSDGDGVVDADDQCPDTPAGQAVDATGCPPDSDGDGVPDYLDECPDSEAGAKVDEKGCYLELEEEVTIDMSIEFETDKADIRPDHLSEINRAVNFLRQYPDTNAVIEGHTDSDGAASYNQELSERRAKAVYDYLINEAGVRAGRLTWAGFGETQPIATNDTVAGKQRNRRVTAVVSGTHKVRQ
ncbi:MAG: OmpA family protein [Pseudomonadota bacterium]